MTVTRIVTSHPRSLRLLALLRSLTSKNADSYENGRSEASKTRTAPTIPVPVHIFASAGLAVRGPYHGGGVGGGMGGGAVDTGHDTIYPIFYLLKRDYRV